MKWITLMTDFGLQDGYAGVMKGVIYRIVPDAKITDISHAIHPQDVRQGCLALGRSYHYFPEGTIHVAVIDPGVGTQRRAIAAKVGKHFYVCPDNGLITIPMKQAQQTGEAIEVVKLDQPRYWLPQVSNVFHGRDIFAPVAAHLANGTPLHEMGSKIEDAVQLEMPEPKAVAHGWRAEVIDIDRFGNLGTNLTEEQLKGQKVARVRVGEKEIEGLVKSYGEREPGSLVALIGADGELAISVVNGSAAKRLKAQVGTQVDVIIGAV